eukprot:6472349-Amphidinium_carterae.2
MAMCATGSYSGLADAQVLETWYLACAFTVALIIEMLLVKICLLFEGAYAAENPYGQFWVQMNVECTETNKNAPFIM